MFQNLTIVPEDDRSVPTNTVVAWKDCQRMKNPPQKPLGDCRWIAQNLLHPGGVWEELARGLECDTGYLFASGGSWWARRGAGSVPCGAASPAISITARPNARYFTFEGAGGTRAGLFLHAQIYFWPTATKTATRPK